jgi:hypothetical protein
VAVGCNSGRHRSVAFVQRLAAEPWGALLAEQHAYAQGQQQQQQPAVVVAAATAAMAAVAVLPRCSVQVRKSHRDVLLA